MEEAGSRQCRSLIVLLVGEFYSAERSLALYVLYVLPVIRCVLACAFRTYIALLCCSQELIPRVPASACVIVLGRGAGGYEGRSTRCSTAHSYERFNILRPASPASDHLTRCFCPNSGEWWVPLTQTVGLVEAVSMRTRSTSATKVQLIQLNNAAVFLKGHMISVSG